jgi:hypothetical protein
VRRFLLHMIPPALLLIAGLALHPYLPAGDALVPTTSASALDDPKLSRTGRLLEGLAQRHQQPSRREAVGRPGMRFSFVMPDSVKQQYWTVRGEDDPGELKWVDVELAIEGGPHFRILSRVRGSSSANVARKSLSLRLLSSQHFVDDISLRRFFLINLYADPTGFKNRWCFEMLKELGLYMGYHELATVEFNAESQGLYMLLERPEDAIRRTHPDTVSVFRRRTHHFQPKYREPGTDAWEAVRALEECHTTDDFKEQERCYQRTLDLEQYFQWRAFNSLVQNGDSIDELFYYERRADPHSPGRLRIMAWDFDDIQHEPAHPHRVYPDPLMWAAEGELDREIISNPILYARYAAALRGLLNERLTEERLTAELDSVQWTLESMAADLDLHLASRIRQQGVDEIETFRRRLLRRRTELLHLAADRTAKRSSRSDKPAMVTNPGGLSGHEDRRANQAGS